MAFTPRSLVMPYALFVSSIIGGICILLIGMSLHAVISHDRTEAAMYRLLTEKGGVLLSSLESGLRASRREPTARQDFMLEEMAARPDVQFIAITDPEGRILSHNDSARMSSFLQFQGRSMGGPDVEGLAPDEQPRWTLTEMEGTPSFVVYKQVGTIRVPGWREYPEEGRSLPTLNTIAIILFVGLDPTPLFLAQDEDRQRTFTMAVGGLLCAVLGAVALHWAVKARKSRQGQRAAEALTEKMMLSLPDGLVLFDAEGRISHINSVACVWLGTPVPPLGRSAAEALPPGLAVLATRLLQDSSLPDTELSLPCGEKVLPLSVRGAPVETPDEGRVGSIMILRDLSERKNLEAEIRRREKLAAMGNLAAGVAHEIRNPLSSIKGYATYFGARFPEESEDREAARVMVGEVERLNRVITDLLELSRAPSIARRPTDLRQLSEDTIRLIRQDAATRNVHIHLEAPDPAAEPDQRLPMVDVDPDRLRQALLNLCLNALDAMPAGGDLTLAVTRGDSHVVLEAHDTGEGIKPEVLPTIFDPYFTTKGHGTGLGLATVHKIIEAHGGHIIASSMPGHGATFRIFLPLRSPDDSLLESRPAEADPDAMFCEEIV